MSEADQNSNFALRYAGCSKFHNGGNLKLIYAEITRSSYYHVAVWWFVYISSEMFQGSEGARVHVGPALSVKTGVAARHVKTRFFKIEPLRPHLNQGELPSNYRKDRGKAACDKMVGFRETAISHS